MDAPVEEALGLIQRRYAATQPQIAHRLARAMKARSPQATDSPRTVSTFSEAELKAFQGHRLAKALYITAMSHLERGEEALAFGLLRQIDNKNPGRFWPVNRHLGRLALFGAGRIEADVNLALRHLLLAAEAGCQQSQHFLLHAPDLPMDAARWCQFAEKLKSEEQSHKRAWPHSVALAIHCYQKAAALGDAVAAFQCAELYLPEKGTAPSPYYAFMYYRQAESLGHKEAQAKLSDLDFWQSRARDAKKARNPQAVEYLMCLAHLDENGDAAFDVAECFMRGKYNTPVSYADALFWYEHAASLGSDKATEVLEQERGRSAYTALRQKVQTADVLPAADVARTAVFTRDAVAARRCANELAEHYQEGGRKVRAPKLVHEWAQLVERANNHLTRAHPAPETLQLPTCLEAALKQADAAYGNNHYLDALYHYQMALVLLDKQPLTKEKLTHLKHCYLQLGKIFSTGGEGVPRRYALTTLYWQQGKKLGSRKALKALSEFDAKSQGERARELGELLLPSAEMVYYAAEWGNVPYAAARVLAQRLVLSQFDEEPAMYYLFAAGFAAVAVAQAPALALAMGATGIALQIAARFAEKPVAKAAASYCGMDADDSELLGWVKFSTWLAANGVAFEARRRLLRWYYPEVYNKLDAVSSARTELENENYKLEQETIPEIKRRITGLQDQLKNCQDAGAQKSIQNEIDELNKELELGLLSLEMCCRSANMSAREVPEYQEHSGASQAVLNKEISELQLDRDYYHSLHSRAAATPAGSTDAVSLGQAASKLDNFEEHYTFLKPFSLNPRKCVDQMTPYEGNRYYLHNRLFWMRQSIDKLNDIMSEIRDKQDILANGVTFFSDQIKKNLDVIKEIEQTIQVNQQKIDILFGNLADVDLTEGNEALAKIAQQVLEMRTALSKVHRILNEINVGLSSLLMVVYQAFSADSGISHDREYPQNATRTLPMDVSPVPTFETVYRTLYPEVFKRIFGARLNVIPVGEASEYVAPSDGSDANAAPEDEPMFDGEDFRVRVLEEYSDSEGEEVIVADRPVSPLHSEDDDVVLMGPDAAESADSSEGDSEVDDPSRQLGEAVLEDDDAMVGEEYGEAMQVGDVDADLPRMAPDAIMRSLEEGHHGEGYGSDDSFSEESDTVPPATPYYLGRSMPPRFMEGAGSAEMAKKSPLGVACRLS